MNTSQLQLGIIGCGNMANAIVSGAISSHFLSPHQILALTHNKAKDRIFKRQHNIKFVDTVSELLQSCSVILLAVKPKSMHDVLQLIKPHCNKHLFITVAAGLSCKSYHNLLGANIKLVRAMPNTPSFINLGVTALFYNKHVKSAEKAFARDLFGSIGSVFDLKTENQMHAVTALSGSGPAFVFSYLEALIQTAKASGLKENVATEMLIDTVVGSALYMKQSGKSAGDLIRQVASKGGTTEQGLLVLQKKSFAKILAQCFNATKKKSESIT